jgi:hypothetical protein
MSLESDIDTFRGDLSDFVGYLDREDGPPLKLWPGREVVARVVRTGAGRATLALAGVEIDVAAEARLAPGATVRLRVDAVGEGRIALRLVGTGDRPSGGVDRQA